MKRKLLVFLLLTAATGFGLAQGKSKKHSNVPEAFENAHSVFVETRDGGDITDIKLDPEDRNAVLDMQDSIQNWGRYSLSTSRHDADLVFVVYKGRLLRDRSPNGTLGNSGASVGHAPGLNPADASQSPNGIGPNGYTQENDELRVYTIQADGKLKGPIWRSEQERGLKGPNCMLLQRLKAEVEKAYPSAPTKPQSTP